MARNAKASTRPIASGSAPEVDAAQLDAALVVEAVDPLGDGVAGGFVPPVPSEFPFWFEPLGPAAPWSAASFGRPMATPPLSPPVALSSALTSSQPGGRQYFLVSVVQDGGAGVPPQSHGGHVSPDGHAGQVHGVSLPPPEPELPEPEPPEPDEPPLALPESVAVPPEQLAPTAISRHFQPVVQSASAVHSTSFGRHQALSTVHVSSGGGAGSDAESQVHASGGGQLQGGQVSPGGQVGHAQPAQTQPVLPPPEHILFSWHSKPASQSVLAVQSFGVNTHCFLVVGVHGVASGGGQSHAGHGLPASHGGQAHVDVLPHGSSTS